MGRRMGAGRRRDIRTPLDCDGFPILDYPGASLRARYDITVSRYTLALWLMPRLAALPLTRHIYAATIVDDVLRHLHRDYEIGKPMSPDGLDQYFERYAARVESDGRTEAWDEHAERLLIKYGSGLASYTMTGEEPSP